MRYVAMSKTEKERRALAAIEPEKWARELVRRVRARPDDEPTLFELRWAYEAHRRGIQVEYEWQTGVSTSSVDFRFKGSPAWNVELVSPQISDAVQDATSVEWPNSFISVETTALGFGNDDDKAAPEWELLRMQRLVAKKVFDGKVPTKFPPPRGREFNVIVVDTRAFLGGDEDVDRNDLLQLVYGPAAVEVKEFRAIHRINGGPIRGLFEEANQFAWARAARERVHLLIAIHERTFDDDEIQQTMVILPNFTLLTEDDARSFPLRWSSATAAVLRDENPLWYNG